MGSTARLAVETRRQDVSAGAIDTVVVALTDRQGRMQGTRVHAPHVVEEVLGHGDAPTRWPSMRT